VRQLFLSIDVRAPGLRFGLMVGIGMPTLNSTSQIRLGHGMRLLHADWLVIKL
jgi:hypothetical protein